MREITWSVKGTLNVLLQSFSPTSIYLTGLQMFESIPHASTPTFIITTKFEVDMTIHCRVTAFLSADTSRDLVTLTFDLLTLSSCHTWRVTWPTLPPSLKTPRLFVHELRVITFPIGGGEKRLHFWNPRSRFACTLYNFGGSTMNIIKVMCENNARHEILRMREITWSV